MKLKKGDLVKIISGKDKGKEGKLEKVFENLGKVTVSGVGVVKRHVKPGRVSKEGGIVSIEKPIAVSSVMLVCPNCKVGVRTGSKLVDGKTHRVCKKCGNVL